jgi:beta-mannosidase
VPVPADREARRSQVLVCELVGAGQPAAPTVVALAPDKDLALRRPSISVRITAGGDATAQIRLRSDTLARWVELSLPGWDVRFSENYFDLPAGREVPVSFELPPGLSLDAARSALRIRSLADTY